LAASRALSAPSQVSSILYLDQTLATHCISYIPWQ